LTFARTAGPAGPLLSVRAKSQCKIMEAIVELPQVHAILAISPSTGDRLRHARGYLAPGPANTCDHRTAARRVRCCDAATLPTAWPKCCRPCLRRYAREDP